MKTLLVIFVMCAGPVFAGTNIIDRLQVGGGTPAVGKALVATTSGGLSDWSNVVMNPMGATLNANGNDATNFLSVVSTGTVQGSTLTITNQSSAPFQLGPLSYFKNTAVGQVSNTTSETHIISTNSTSGRSQGLQPGEMATGTIIRFRGGGQTTQTSGQNIQFRFYLNNTAVIDTGSVAGFNITTGCWHVDGEILFISATKARGWMNIHYPGVADRPNNSTTLTSYATIDNTVANQMRMTVTPNSSAFVMECDTFIVEVR